MPTTGALTVFRDEASLILSVTLTCLSFSFGLRLFLPFPLAEWGVDEPLTGDMALCPSSGASSRSSVFGRFPLPLVVLVDSERRWFGPSLTRGGGGAESESGDLEVLADAEGAERRPDRRGSLGDNGGPMVAA